MLFRERIVASIFAFQQNNDPNSAELLQLIEDLQEDEQFGLLGMLSLSLRAKL